MITILLSRSSVHPISRSSISSPPSPSRIGIRVHIHRRLMLVFIFFRQDRTYRIHRWGIAIWAAQKTISTSSVLWWSVCSFAYSDGGILLIANAEMLNMVYKTNYSSACSCRFLSITFFFAATDRHPARKRKTCIYTDTMQSRNTTMKNLSFIKRAEQTNSSTTICSHTLTRNQFRISFSLLFLISHFPFSNHLCFDPLTSPSNIEPLNLLSIYLYTLLSLSCSQMKYICAYSRRRMKKSFLLLFFFSPLCLQWLTTIATSFIFEFQENRGLKI